MSQQHENATTLLGRIRRHVEAIARLTRAARDDAREVLRHWRDLLGAIGQMKEAVVDMRNIATTIGEDREVIERIHGQWETDIANVEGQLKEVKGLVKELRSDLEACSSSVKSVRNLELSCIESTRMVKSIGEIASESMGGLEDMQSPLKKVGADIERMASRIHQTDRFNARKADILSDHTISQDPPGGADLVPDKEATAELT